jgi:hypothetical protein
VPTEAHAIGASTCKNRRAIRSVEHRCVRVSII